jgi:toxin ParE1/3/4
MAEIRWTMEASNWLQNIYDYISLENPNAAQRVVEGIYKKVQILKEFPRIGHIYRREAEGEIRILLYGHYKIAYLAQSDDTIQILGIFHSTMEIERYLGKKN